MLQTIESPPSHRKRVGLNPLAFEAANPDDVDAATAKLRDRGVAILYEGDHRHAGGDNRYAVFFEDPNRIKVELIVGSRGHGPTP